METATLRRSASVPDLLALGPRQKEVLKKRIARWDGLVRVFIHPMYEKWRGHEKEYKDDPRLSILIKIEKTLARLVAMPCEKTPPIIVFEEETHIEKLEKWTAEKSGKRETNCYHVSTEVNNPTVIGYGWSRDLGWNKISKAFDGLVIKRILIGGIRLEMNTYENDWTGKAPYMCRCVGIALSYLSKKKGGTFDVDISALTDPPGSRQYLARFS